MLMRKLERLGADASAEEVLRTRERFIEEQSERMPYVPDSVYALIRDEHSPPREQ
jgi:hypothetical protein